MHAIAKILELESKVQVRKVVVVLLGDAIPVDLQFLLGDGRHVSHDRFGTRP